MDPDAISRQARAAIDSLTMQLQALEAQQSALLSSIHLTLASLSPNSPTTTTTAIPNYHLISPTLSLIPVYTAKLTRLRTLMSSQTLEITQLRRRVEEVKRQRRRNLERTWERWERDRERDRTVLRAKMAVESLNLSPRPRVLEGDMETSGGENGGGGEISEGGIVNAPLGTPLPMSPTPPLSSPVGQESGGIRVVKRKKKVRQVEMQ